jgi:hypothetical protein
MQLEYQTPEERALPRKQKLLWSAGPFWYNMAMSASRHANIGMPACLSVLILLILAAGAAGELCTDRGTITLVKESGSVIIVDKVTIWDVEKEDQETSAFWLPGQSVMVCGDRMLNLDNHEVVALKGTKHVVRTPADAPAPKDDVKQAPTQPAGSNFQAPNSK